MIIFIKFIKDVFSFYKYVFLTPSADEGQEMQSFEHMPCLYKWK